MSSVFQLRARLRSRAAWSLLWLGSTSVPGLAADLSPTTQATAAVATPAQAKLGLSDLIRAVVQNNPGLIASRRSAEAAGAAVTSASALPNPRLEIGTGRSSARLPNAIAGATAGWAVSQFIENPDLRRARIAAAEHGERGSAQQVAVNTNELVAQVRVKAFEYLLRQEEADAAADAFALLEQIRSRVKVRVESGEAARYEIIKADAEIINAQQKLLSARLQVEQAALAINRLAAGALPPWTLAERLGDTLETPELDEIKQYSAQNNPEIKALKALLAQREARLREVQASRWPGIEVRMQQARDPELRQAMVVASMQIPLLDQRSGPVAEAVAERERARGLLEGRQAELNQQLLMAWKAMELARVRVKALSTGAVREADAALRVAEAAYRFGERGILDVLNAQRLVRAVRADLLDARFQLQIANVDLDYLAGRYADALSPAASSVQP